MDESMIAASGAPAHTSAGGHAPLPLPLRAERVRKTLDGREILQDVSFDLRERQFVALLGPSGAGKTTLLRCVSGLTGIDRGEISVAGVGVTELHGHARRRVAVIFQQFNLVSRLTALDNVLAGRLGHVSGWRGIARRFTRGDRMLALEWLERVGLLAHAMQRVDALSGGQQQRVAIARAMVQQPDLIVADEPVSSLDPGSGAGILELLRAACREADVAVLCSLHQVELARRFADRIVGLRAGRVALDVSADMFDHALERELYGTASGHRATETS